MLLFNNYALAFEEELCCYVLVLRVKQLPKAALFTDYKMRSLLATLVAAVKARLGLLIVLNIKDLAQPHEKLSLSAVGGSMYQDAVGLVLLVQDKVLHYVLDEGSMLGGFY